MPKIDQSGLVAAHKGITKAGDAGLRQALYMAADHARHIDPTLAQRYYRLVIVEGKHHNSALCSVSPSSPSPGSPPVGASSTNSETKTVKPSPRPKAKLRVPTAADLDPKVRAARRRNTPAKIFKNRVAGRGRKESAQKVAPATDPPQEEASENVA